jgi:hypothetical protein
MPENRLVSKLAALFRNERKPRVTGLQLPVVLNEQGLPGIRVDFFDWNGPQAAAQHHVEPGFYMAVEPVTERQFRERELLDKLMPSLFKKLAEVGKLPDSELKIPIGEQGKLFADPGNAWFFSIVTYDSQSKSVLLKAAKVDLDYASGSIENTVKS